jgi:uncharacterized NAD(P)/FAD-binding protein YdhS
VSRPATVGIVGGGPSGTLAAIQLLRRGWRGLEIVVVEPREALGSGIAFATPEPFHRINVPAAVMSALPEDLDHFRAWADVAPGDYPARATWGRYLEAVLEAAVAASPARLRHLRGRATGLAEVDGHLALGTDADGVLEPDAVVVATGNELPAIPVFAEGVAADPRFVADPWGSRWLDEVSDGAVVAIIGTGHTAMDVAASVLNARPAARVIAISRHGEVPRPHEDPWRPRPSEPAFTVEEFRAFADPLVEARARIAAYPDGWIQGLDSIRPITQALWGALDPDQRRRFVAEWRRDWEIHRSRFGPQMAAEVHGFVDRGRLVVEAASIAGIGAGNDGLRVEGADGRTWNVDRVVLATGPTEQPSASPFLALSMALGTLRAGPLGLGIDADPATLRAIDADGSMERPVWAIGPMLRGVLWETIAIPEIRVEAAMIAEGIVDALGG